MKKQKTQSKIIVALSAVVLLLVALSATLTFAYFTASKDATSSPMTFGTLTMENITLGISDGDSAPKHITTTEGVLTELVPGCIVNLSGNITVEQNIDSFVRFRIGVKMMDGENALSDNAALADAGVVLAALQGIDVYDAESNNDGLWFAGATPNALDTAAAANNKHGIANVLWTSYYYKQVPAENTGLVLDLATAGIKFAFPTSLNNDWQGKKVVLVIQADAIQADHLTTPNAALSGSSNISTLEAESAWNDNITIG